MFDDRFEHSLRFREAIARGLSPHGAAALDAVTLPTRATCIDLGAGFGDSSRLLACKLGESGAVTGYDLAPRFIAEANREVPAGVRFLVADVERHPLGSGASLAFSQFGTMFFQNPLVAFTNIRRALASNGQLCMAVWRRREDNAFIHDVDVVAAHVLGVALPSTSNRYRPGPYSLASADLTSEVLLRSGFTDVVFRRHDAARWVGATVDDAVEYSMLLGSAGEALAQGTFTNDQRSALRCALARKFEPWLCAAGVYCDSSAWLVTARADPAFSEASVLG